MNKEKLDQLQAQLIAKGQEIIDPFALVQADLAYTKDFAIENILRTRYSELEGAAHYNLLLKGKNFRSAILFLLAKAIYYQDSHSAAKIKFEETLFYE